MQYLCVQVAVRREVLTPHDGRPSAPVADRISNRKVFATVDPARELTLPGRVFYCACGTRPPGVLTLHRLRKPCGRNGANPLPIRVTMKLMGHSSVTTRMFYSQVETYHHAQKAKALTLGLATVGIVTISDYWLFTYHDSGGV